MFDTAAPASAPAIAPHPRLNLTRLTDTYINYSSVKCEVIFNSRLEVALIEMRMMDLCTLGFSTRGVMMWAGLDEMSLPCILSWSRLGCVY